MKKYFYLKIVLYPQGKTVKDAAYHCTEERFHEICFDICNKLNEAGMSFDGTNPNHYYEVETMEAPSPEELTAVGL